MVILYVINCVGSDRNYKILRNNNWARYRNSPWNTTYLILFWGYELWIVNYVYVKLLTICWKDIDMRFSGIQPTRMILDHLRFEQPKLGFNQYQYSSEAGLMPWTGLIGNPHSIFNIDQNKTLLTENSIYIYIICCISMFVGLIIPMHGRGQHLPCWSIKSPTWLPKFLFGLVEFSPHWLAKPPALMVKFQSLIS
jgi:hypothetical protein